MIRPVIEILASGTHFAVKILSESRGASLGSAAGESTLLDRDFMRHRGDNLSQSFLTPSDPDPAIESSVLLIVAGRMQGENFRYQLVTRGFEVDLARSVS